MDRHIKRLCLRNSLTKVMVWQAASKYQHNDERILWKAFLEAHSSFLVKHKLIVVSLLCPCS